MKKILNKIGIFLTKKLHLLSVFTHFKKQHLDKQIDNKRLTVKQIQKLYLDHFDKIGVKLTDELKEEIKRKLKEYYTPEPPITSAPPLPSDPANNLSIRYNNVIM